MNTKLTLSIDSKTVEKAKKYAKKRGTSISKIFEEHIYSLTVFQKMTRLILWNHYAN